MHKMYKTLVYYLLEYLSKKFFDHRSKLLYEELLQQILLFLAHPSRIEHNSSKQTKTNVSILYP